MSAASADRFRHEALMYGSREEFLAGTLPFIRDGVRSGEPVLVVESPEKIGMLRAALGDDASAVIFADMAEVGANPARIIPAWQDFVSQHGAGAKRLRGIGEPIWLGRSADELAECQRHESLLNVAFASGRPWWLLCPYDTSQLAADVIDEARRSHEFVCVEGTAGVSDGFRGVDACGAGFDAALPEPPDRTPWIVFDADRLIALRRAVSRFAYATGLSAGRATELATAVNEVATNSVVHGGGKGTLRMWKDGGTLLCEVSDGGRYDRPLADRERPLADASGPGGLWLANQLCDLVQIRSHDQGTVVRLHVRDPLPSGERAG
ncbi:MAG TPA: sensor histidine kinase [Candidatus Dormibacteraeota bacterium]|nr:sensor histidine kinase [Candidatus Dormibacteraeota bacterium]